MTRLMKKPSLVRLCAAICFSALLAVAQTAPPAAKLDLKLPLKAKSIRFAVIGDNGTGTSEEYEVAQQMERYREAVGYDFVVMMGDNIYGGHKPQDFVKKFEQPYKPLLDAGVKFYATLGNHDDPDIERNYKLYDMGGQRYYNFKKGDVEFFVLDSTYMDPTQLTWAKSKLESSTAKWKICYFHHPLFSDGKFHGSDLDLRSKLMPMFQVDGVNVVLSGHDHVYERIKPQSGIYFWVVGNSGELRAHDLRPSPNTAQGFDTDRTFMLVEIDGDQLYFQTLSRAGVTIDSGTLERQKTGK